MRDKLSNRKLCKFGLLIGFGFPFFIGWIIPKIIGNEFNIWTLFVGFTFVFLGITNPRTLSYPFKIFMKIFNLIETFSDYIILSLIFFTILLPVSLLMKFFKYDPLSQKKSEGESYRENKINKEINLKNIF